MHCEIGGTQGPLGYVSALGATRLVHWLILVAPSCLRSHNARYIMLKSLNNTYAWWNTENNSFNRYSPTFEFISASLKILITTFVSQQYSLVVSMDFKHLTIYNFMNAFAKYYGCHYALPIQHNCSPKMKSNPLSGCPAMTFPWHFPDHYVVFPDHETYYLHFITPLTLLLQAIWQITHQK